MESQVDVVIPTFRRPEALAACLESIRRQSVPVRSIEVVDDSETDYGPGISRNVGWKRGTGNIVAFIDDDCIADENWIECIQDVFQIHELGGIEGGITTTELDGGVIDFNPPNRFKWDRFKTANMAVRREVLEEIGGFDERYFLHREDTDLAWRIIDSGHRMAWAPQCKVHHPEPIGIHGAVYGAYPRSEQLLYHCNPRKFVECAAGMISSKRVLDGSLRKLRREMRKLHEPEDVAPLTATQSISLWTKAWMLAVRWKLVSLVVGEPKEAPRLLRL
ncbi:MAG TPA: glycosyltransferase [Candidatus Thalassarchaeaceae archaeon]|jgi:glycosyltransferase involved in cell wall biosynthesis|nr:glycosyltransferase [Candidatus Thalassarchaeaceae archaeon]|tara:strand:- start:6172 stop:6999 length:828 start_codon:yes stop_codon:yes gene_type:complete